MSTAPAPDGAGPPGMCPGVTVEGGGTTGAGGGGGGGKGGKGGGGAGGGDGADGANGGKQGAPDPAKYPECGTASHPVDVVTGRAFTHPIEDFRLEGPLPFVFTRSASSFACRRDFGLGWTWGHTLGWEIEIRRTVTRVWCDTGVAVDFPRLEQGQSHVGQWGWLIRRESWGYVVDTDDGLIRILSTEVKKGRRYRLTAIEDRNKNRIVCVYDETGRILREVQDSAGRTIRVKSDAAGRVEQFLVQNSPSQGRWVALATFTHDGSGNLTSATDADQFTSRYEYDGEHRLTKDKDRTGLTFHFRFDKQGRCVESWGDYDGAPDKSLAEPLPATLSDGLTPCKGIHHCTFLYQDDGFSVVTDSTQFRNYQGNEHGLIDKMESGGAELQCTYGPRGHLMSRTDGEGARTEWERDERGRILKVTDPLGRVTTVERDAFGLPVRIVDPEGGETLITRDGRGNVLAVREPAGAFTQFERDGRGLPTKVTESNGAVTIAEYDAQGNQLAIRQPDGGEWRSDYDYWGRCLRAGDPTGAVTSYAHSDRGDLIALRDASGASTRYQHDGERQLISTQDPRGRVTRYTWGGYHRLCSRTDANGNSARFGYDAEGRLTHVWNQVGEVYRLAYTPFGHLTDEWTFDRRHLHYRYDRAGQVVSARLNNRAETQFVYDLAGQMVARTAYDGSAESFAYDKRGSLIRAKNARVLIEFERDGAGNIVRETQSLDGVAHTIETERDLAGRRAGRLTSLGHREVVRRDLLGNRVVTDLDGREISHLSDAMGRDLSRLLPQGGRIDSAYDALGRLVQRRSAAPVAALSARESEPTWLGSHPQGVTANRAFRHDVDGELVEIWDHIRGRTQLTYDPIGQLLSFVPEKARAELFEYDARGNVHEAEAGGPARRYGEGSRLQKRGDATYLWDSDGRISEKRRSPKDPAAGSALPPEPDDVWRYTWSASGAMERAEHSDGTVVTFGYDAFSRRVEKRVSTRQGAVLTPVRTVRFVWDGEVLVHELRHEFGRGDDPIVEERTYWFDDDNIEPLAHRESRRDDVGRMSGGWFHYLNDPTGTPERLVDERGEVAAEYKRAAWGGLELAEPARASTPIRMPGQYADEETGLHYNWFRYYDPNTGRFTSRDPIQLLGGLNPTRYANNPFAWLDPLGLATKHTPNTGVVYLRTDRVTGQQYIGKSKSKESYNRRKAAHEKAAGGCAATPRYKFQELETGIAGEPALSQAEEDWIRVGGGPAGPGKPGLANQRHEQSSSNYKGNIPFP